MRVLFVMAQMLGGVGHLMSGNGGAPGGGDVPGAILTEAGTQLAAESGSVLVIE